MSTVQYLGVFYSQIDCREVVPAWLWNWGKWGFKEYKRKGSFHGWFIGLVVAVEENCCPVLAALLGQVKKYFFPHRTLFQFMSLLLSLKISWWADTVPCILSGVLLAFASFNTFYQGHFFTCSLPTFFQQQYFGIIFLFKQINLASYRANPSHNDLCTAILYRCDKPWVCQCLWFPTQLPQTAQNIIE